MANSLPFGEIIKTPFGPVVKIFPLLCTFNPSNPPGYFLLSSVPSKKSFSSKLLVLNLNILGSFLGSELFT